MLCLVCDKTDCRMKTKYYDISLLLMRCDVVLLIIATSVEEITEDHWIQAVLG